MAHRRTRTAGRPFLRAAAAALLLCVAIGGVAYPLWWDHRSSAIGHALLQRVVRGPARTSTHAGEAQSCVGDAAAPTRQRPGVLAIPAIGLSAPVLEGLSNSVLDVAVGHDPSTVWPGSRGESLLLAHDVTYFSRLDRVRQGAIVTFTSGCERSVFRVIANAVMRPGTALAIPPSGSGLALITCWPTNALFWTPLRYVVELQLVARLPLKKPSTSTPSSLVPLTVPALPALDAQGLSIAQSGVLVGRLTVSGSPSASFREGPEPLAVAKVALREYAAVIKTVAAGNLQWWSALTVKGVPMPTPWSLAYDTNVTLVVKDSTVESAVLSTPAVGMTLTVQDGVLLVADVKTRNIGH